MFTGKPRAINCVTSGAVASHAQSDDRAKTKSGNKQRNTGNSAMRNCRRGTNVILLADTAIVNSSAETRATKIETQYRERQSVDGFGGLENDFVVHGAAEKRVRMTDQGGEWRQLRRARSPQDGFQAADRAGEKSFANRVIRSCAFANKLVLA